MSGVDPRLTVPSGELLQPKSFSGGMLCDESDDDDDDHSVVTRFLRRMTGFALTRDNISLQ